MAVVRLLAVVAALLLLSFQESNACSCMRSHPQTQACNADFVILARVKAFKDHDNYMRVYKLQIKETFKSNEKAQAALRHGRVLTSSADSLCGVSLEAGRLYVLSGMVGGGKARINLCGFHRRWEELSPRQRKGFRRMYLQSCHCQVSTMSASRPHQKDECAYWTWRLPSDCQAEHGVCMRHPEGRCLWLAAKPYKTCLQSGSEPSH